MRRGGWVAFLAVAGFCHVNLDSAWAQTSWSDLLNRGYKLPKRWGLGVNYYSQDQPYRIDSLKLGLPGLDPALAHGLKVDNSAVSTHLVLDYWLLPFVDLELLAGHIDGKTDVALSKVNVGIPLSNITVNYDGLFYGAGFTLAAGGRRYFGTLTTEYTNTKLREENSSVSAWVVTPRLGINVGRASALYVGGMYERPEEEHKGAYTVPGVGTVPYDVVLSGKYSWSYIAGANFGLGEHFVLTLEGGFGDRDAALAYLSYRW
jgi:hypothetical protein